MAQHRHSGSGGSFIPNGVAAWREDNGGEIVVSVSLLLVVAASRREPTTTMMAITRMGFVLVGVSIAGLS
jgi:hypothetical protein